jgi:hypothetical protein
MESFNIGSNYKYKYENVRICLTVGGEEKGHCDIGLVHGGIPHDGLALQVEVPMSATSILGPKVGEEC